MNGCGCSQLKDGPHGSPVMAGLTAAVMATMLANAVMVIAKETQRRRMT